MNEISSKKSILQDILRIYSVILHIAVYVSSFAFLSLVLFIFLRFVKFNIEFLYIIALFLIVFVFFVKIKNRRIRKTGYYLGKIATISVSVFILLLFLNSYLKIFDNLNQFFTVILEILESFANRFTLGMLFAFGSILLYVYFASLFLRFILKKAQKIGKFANIVLCLIAIVIIIFPFLYFLNKSSFLSLNDLFYSNFNWFFGFSLISLHLNYIFKEIKAKINSNIGPAPA